MNKILHRLLIAAVVVWGGILVYDSFSKEKEPSDLTESEWIIYTSEEDLFVVQLPAVPEVTKESFGLESPNEFDLHVHTAIDWKGGEFAIYAVHYSDLPNVQRDDFLLQVIYQVLNISRANLLRDIEESPLQGHKGYTLTMRQGDRVVGYLAVQRGGVVYMVGYSDTVVDYDPDRFLRFSETFRLLEE